MYRQGLGGLDGSGSLSARRYGVLCVGEVGRERSTSGGEVLVDLGLPVLQCAFGVDLELEPVHHLRFDVVDIDVELFVPAAELIDGSVFLGQQRVVNARLVLPDRDILLEADGYPLRDGFSTITPYCSRNDVGVTG